MSNLRKSSGYGMRPVEAASVDLRPLFHVWISAEGKKTEPQYFKGLSDLAIELGIDGIVRIELLEQEGQHKSHPKHVVALMDKQAKEFDYKNNKDVYFPCVVVDRDWKSFKEEQLDRLIVYCEKEDYNLVLSNPNFELWLLMHLVDLSIYTEEALLANRNINKNKKFIVQEVEVHLNPSGYDKKVDFSKFKEHINYAIGQSKEYATEFPPLKNHIGSQVGLLIEKLFRGYEDGLGAPFQKNN